MVHKSQGSLDCCVCLGLRRSRLFVTVVATAQVERGTVTGRLSIQAARASWAPLSHIRETSTNVETKTQTNSDGIYYLPSLASGQVRVARRSERLPVFGNFEHPLDANLTATFNVTLESGSLNQAVTVEATAVQLESQTSDVGKALTTRTIAELPDLGRNPLQLAAIAPGAQPVGGAAVNSSAQQAGNPSTVIRLSGGTASQNAVLTDGGESRAFHSSTASVVPLESIAEFRLDMATYSAEFGRSGGGVFNIVTKSGTNRFHGVGYEFLQNNNLNGNTWQNNRTNVFPRSLSAEPIRRSDRRAD